MAEPPLTTKSAEADAIAALLKHTSDVSYIPPAERELYYAKIFSETKGDLLFTLVVDALKKQGRDMNAPTTEIEPETGRFISVLQQQREKLNQQTSDALDAGMRKEFLKAFPDTDPKTIENDSQYSLFDKWRQRAAQDPSRFVPTGDWLNEWHNRIYIEQTKAWASANGVDVNALEAHADKTLSSVRAGDETLLTAHETHSLLVGVLNVQFNDYQRKSVKQGESMPAEYTGHYDERTVTDIYVIKTSEDSEKALEALRKAYPNQLGSLDASMNDFNAAGKPVVLKWVDDNNIPHTAVIVSRDWANRHAGEMARAETHNSDIRSVESLGTAASVQWSNEYIAEQTRIASEAAKAREEKKKTESAPAETDKDKKKPQETSSATKASAMDAALAAAGSVAPLPMASQDFTHNDLGAANGTQGKGLRPQNNAPTVV